MIDEGLILQLLSMQIRIEDTAPSMDLCNRAPHQLSHGLVV